MRDACVLLSLVIDLAWWLIELVPAVRVTAGACENCRLFRLETPLLYLLPLISQTYCSFYNYI